MLPLGCREPWPFSISAAAITAAVVAVPAAAVRATNGLFEAAASAAAALVVVAPHAVVAARSPGTQVLGQTIAVAAHVSVQWAARVVAATHGPFGAAVLFPRLPPGW